MLECAQHFGWSEEAQDDSVLEWLIPVTCDSPIDVGADADADFVLNLGPPPVN